MKKYIEDCFSWSGPSLGWGQRGRRSPPLFEGSYKNVGLNENEIAKNLFVPVYSKPKRGPCTWLKNYVIILLFVVNVRYKVHSINADVLIQMKNKQMIICQSNFQYLMYSTYYVMQFILLIVLYQKAYDTQVDRELNGK